MTMNEQGGVTIKEDESSARREQSRKRKREE